MEVPRIQAKEECYSSEKIHVRWRKHSSDSSVDFFWQSDSEIYSEVCVCVLPTL